MNTSKQLATELEDAVDALQPFYDPGDDGYPVTLALDAIAGVLGNKVGADVSEDRGLTALLEQLAAPDDVIDTVKKLYDNAAGGEYGSGLSSRQAKIINDAVQDVVEPLIEFVLGSKKRKGRAAGSKRRSRKKM